MFEEEQRQARLERGEGEEQTEAVVEYEVVPFVNGKPRGRWRREHFHTSDAERELIKGKFLEEYRERGAISPAARAVGVDAHTIYNWADDDPEFKTAIDYGHEDVHDGAQQSLYQRALHEKGMPGVIAGIAVAKRFHPERWSDKYMAVEAAQGGELAKAIREATALLMMANSSEQQARERTGASASVLIEGSLAPSPSPSP